MSQYKEKAETLILPVVPLRDAVAFPGMPIDFETDDGEGLAAIKQAESGGMTALLVSVKEQPEDEIKAADLYSVGTVVKIRQSVATPNGKRLICECSSRAAVSEYMQVGDLITARVIAKDVRINKNEIYAEACVLELRRAFEKIARFQSELSSSAKLAVNGIDDPGLLSDLIASIVLVRNTDKQAVLAEFEPLARAALLLQLIDAECELLECEEEIRGKTRDCINRNQREYYLREQIKVIREELGEDEDPDDCTARIAEADLPSEVREKLLKENERLAHTPFGSAEATVLRNYIDVVLELPWNKRTKDRASVAAAKKILDADHDGMEKVKERILEFIAVKQLNPSLNNQILCLVGPPGTGKTSIAASVARALNRKYVRVSLGGVHDESDIRGHRKTYVASMPGRIISALSQVGVNNPLMLLDEIDKMASDSRGDPASAMLEVLDGEQNKTFRDHFVELPFDLSDCLFIATANSLDTVPRPLLDRMEVIELSSYTRNEKLSIAKNHLLPKQLKRHGLGKRTLKISDGAILEIIDCYTREAGVRNLERTIADLCRKAARRIIESDGSVRMLKIDVADVEAYLGGRKIIPETTGADDEVGVVNGLAYTEAGGDLLKIEVAVLEGSGKLELTGSLGDVMKESARTAVTFVRSIASEFGIPADFYKTKDVHVHVPAGAVPKDGPSAGVTMTTALVSALAGIPVSHNVAMTGEVTLTGRVLAIGGLREKTMAAYAAGIKTVIIPEANRVDLSKLDPEVRNGLNFVFAKKAADVLAAALVRTPSTETEENANEATTLGAVLIPSVSNTRTVIRSKRNGN